MRILLIDDEQALLQVFTQTLQSAGLQIITATNGNEGFTKAKSEKPDAILLDQILPDVNGNQVLQMLKNDPETKDIPVAILSNYNQDGMMQQALNAGATDYILKYQIAPQDLVTKVEGMLKTTNPAVQIQTSTQPQTSEPIPTQPQAQSMPSAEQPIAMPTVTEMISQPLVTPTETVQAPMQPEVAIPTPVSMPVTQTPMPEMPTSAPLPQMPTLSVPSAEPSVPATPPVRPVEMQLPVAPITTQEKNVQTNQ